MTEALREIPLSRPWLDEREEELVLEVLRAGRLSLGPWIERFEEEVAARVGAPYAAAVSSGTAGLHLLCRIAGLGPTLILVTHPGARTTDAVQAFDALAARGFGDIAMVTFAEPAPGRLPHAA